MTWAVEFYEEEDGSAPVEKFLAKLPREHRAKSLEIVKLLEEVGPTLAFPYSSQVKGKIRELRTQQGKDKISILYFGDKRRQFILLHAFIKRTEKLSEKDIETAERRMKKHERKTENPAGQKLKARGTRKHQRFPEEVSNMKVDEEGDFLEEGDLFNVKLDEEGNVSVQWKGEWGEGRMWGKVGEMVNFEGRALCGPLQVLAQQQEQIGDYPVKVQHQCEKQDECVARKLLDELEVGEGVSWIQ